MSTISFVFIQSSATSAPLILVCIAAVGRSDNKITNPQNYTPALFLGRFSYLLSSHKTNTLNIFIDCMFYFAIHYGQAFIPHGRDKRGWGNSMRPVEFVRAWFACDLPLKGHKSAYELATNLKTKGSHLCKPLFIWWVVRDLNHGPKDYEYPQNPVLMC